MTHLKRTAVIIALALLTALTSACAGRSGAGVILAGSTSVQPYAEKLAEEYAHTHPYSEIDVQGGGSSAGITAAESGTADIGMSSRALKESEGWLWSAEIAKDGLAMIVHPDNPVGGLTLEQIRGIYSGEITDWGELGGNPARIHVIAREEGSGTRSAFEDLVMGDGRITPKAIVQNSNGAVRQIVSGDRNSIGFISLGLVDKDVKALELGGVAPSHDNVAGGSYALFRPFLFVANGEPEGEAMLFVDYVLSDEGRELLEHEGLVVMGEGAGQ